MLMTMKKELCRLVVLLALLPVPRVYAQMSFDRLAGKWAEYKECTAGNVSSALYHRFFRDTVSVREMKEAFALNHECRYLRSPYEGLDSAVYVGGGSEDGVLLVSPLRHHPSREIRECRGVWGLFNRLCGLQDKDGVKQEKLLKKVNADKKREWMDGDILRLVHPRWYMGFVVSPRLYWDIYDKGKCLVKMSVASSCAPDFFTHADCTTIVFDGSWDSKIGAGARLLGMLHSMQSTANMGVPERTFSVLLHEVPRVGYSRKASNTSYTLELLLPEDPDPVTMRLFDNLQAFVKLIPGGAFLPYYTTDYRIMTGRYYRVTVNRCGWLLEDYLTINR